jgi:hypothetical protein
MSTTLHAHADGDAKLESPSIKINEQSDYVSIRIEQGDNEVVFYVNKREHETMDSLIGRVTRGLRPEVRVKETV